MDEKYIVFKRNQFFHMLKVAGIGYDETIVVQDAVVIRRQDVFAPPALDAYASSILTAIEGMKATLTPLEGRIIPEDLARLLHETVDKIAQLQKIADYFHEQAQKAWHENKRKLPD